MKCSPGAPAHVQICSAVNQTCPCPLKRPDTWEDQVRGCLTWHKCLSLSCRPLHVASYGHVDKVYIVSSREANLMCLLRTPCSSDELT